MTMGMTMMPSLTEPVAPVRTPIAVGLAWLRYLETARSADAETYERVEERAWRQLERELAALGRPLMGEVPSADRSIGDR